MTDLLLPEAATAPLRASQDDQAGKGPFRLPAELDSPAPGPHGNIGIWLASISVIAGISAIILPLTVSTPRALAALLQIAGLAALVLALAGTFFYYRGVNGRLRNLIGIDYLTGVGNQRAFWDALGRLVALARRSATPLSLILMDLDNFKDVNDEYGHRAGDEVLKAVGQIVREACRGADQVFRYGGDELAILCPDTDARGARELAIRVQSSLSEMPLGYPQITAGVGVAELGSLVAGTDLLDAADSALMAAKYGSVNRGSLRLAAKSGAQRSSQRAGEEMAAARRTALQLACASLDTDAIDPVEHSESVERLVVLVAKRMGVEGEELDKMRLASRVHDVGKVAIPRGIMAKTGALTDAEWSTVRSHPVVGESILSSVPELEPVAGVVRHTHERWDGRGYPDGTAGGEIPLASRIIFVCDSFQAFRHDRPYRGAMTTAEALDHLQECAGSQFDPDVVEALLELVCADRPKGGNISLKRT